MIGSNEEAQPVGCNFSVRSRLEEDGRGLMVFTFSRSLFREVLERYGVQSADDLMPNDGLLRDLVQKFSRRHMQRQVGELVIEEPGSARCLRNETSSDVSNILSRQLRADFEDFALDPSHSVVNVELRVIEHGTRISALSQLGSCVLRTIVGPAKLVGEQNY